MVTWNVLHGVHGSNWSEPAVARHPDEAERVHAIAARVGKLARAGAWLALQEVSGDQLEALRRQAPHDSVVLSHRSPRMPKLRQGSTTLVDRSEHLALIAPASAQLFAAAAYGNDAGKGFLAVRAAELLVVNTHVTFAERGLPQLERLAALCEAHAGPSVVLGDFNAGAAHVQALLPRALLADVSSGARRTRVGDPGHDIDHIAVHRARVADAEVLDGGGLSDHNPVRATIVLD